MTHARLRIAGTVYAALSALAFGWAFLRGDPNPLALFVHPHPLLGAPAWLALPGGVIAGAGVGFFAAWASRFAVRRIGFARALHVEFRALFGPLATREIVLFALYSAVGEELFFRGAMLPAIGLVVSSLLFGAAHVPLKRGLVPWTLSAVGMGFVLGTLFWATGSLLGPLVAHFVVNYENLHFITGYDPTLVSPVAGAAPLGPAARDPSPAGAAGYRAPR